MAEKAQGLQNFIQIYKKLLSRSEVGATTLQTENANMRFAKVPCRFLFSDVTDSCNGGRRGEERTITQKKKKGVRR